MTGTLCPRGEYLRKAGKGAGYAGLGAVSLDVRGGGGFDWGRCQNLPHSSEGWWVVQEEQDQAVAQAVVTWARPWGQ